MKMPSIYILIIFLFAPVSIVYSDNSPDDMVLIKKGCFMMGTDKVYNYLAFGERPNDRERPVHKVCLNPFYLDKYEVTQKNWEKIGNLNNSVIRDENIAVNQITWQEAHDFCQNLGHRLPTEAEWEYAAKAGTSTEYPWGNKIDRAYVWYGGNSGHTHHPVGTRKANPWGLYDMLGGVWEWVNDWYGEFYYKNSPLNNPKGPLNIFSWHVIRGGSWVDEKQYVRTTIRYPGMADNTEDFWVGFRCAHDAL